MPLHTPETIRARVADVRRLRQLLDRLPAGPDPERDGLAADVDDWLEDVSGWLDEKWSSLWGSTVDAADAFTARLVKFLRQRGVDAQPGFPDDPGIVPVWVLVLLGVAVVLGGVSGFFVRGRR